MRAMPLPSVRPIIPTLCKEPFDSPEWLFECKYDGFRGLCYVERDRSRLLSRNGNVFERFAGLAAGIAETLDVDEAVLDGEVIAADATGRPQFYDLLRGRRAPAYVAFDLLWLDGADLRALPLSERRRLLQGILPAGSTTISETLSVEGRGRELFALMCANDLEGIVAKQLGDPYGSKTEWLKIKNPHYSQKEGRAELFNPGRSGQ
jgi:bifunctional non-homologous end joining protein LigD